MGLFHFGFLENNTQNIWNDFWKRYNADVRGVDSWAKRRMVRILSSYIKPNISVLDAGCGTGFFSSYFISCGCEVYSLDYSGEALQIARNITKNRSKMYIEYSILDEAIFSYSDRRFDIIFTDGLLEHYSENEQDRIIFNMKCLKKDNGYMINFVPNRFSFWSMIRPFYINIKERPFVMKKFLNLHTRNSLNILSYGGINVLPFRLSPERLLGRYFGILFYCISK